LHTRHPRWCRPLAGNLDGNVKRWFPVGRRGSDPVAARRAL